MTIGIRKDGIVLTNKALQGLKMNRIGKDSEGCPVKLEFNDRGMPVIGMDRHIGKDGFCEYARHKAASARAANVCWKVMRDLNEGDYAACIIADPWNPAFCDVFYFSL